jgi:twitching motility protein PilT
MPHIDTLFHKMIEIGASDLHMTSECVPMFRLHGDMQAVEGQGPIGAGQMEQILLEIAPDLNQKQFLSEWDTDFAYEIEGLARFRCNLFMDRKGPGAVFRQIPSKVLTAEQLNLPKAVLDLCFLSKGLVVVTGPTGSGKSTTLAAMIDHINKHRRDHIITIEDPIEFVHDDQRCRINQREVHRHTGSFKRALRAALREDPDIVLVGEMRDLETIEIALETAETGHLVFGTLHTNTAASTVDRIIDQFPADRQSQIRTMMSSSLKGVVAQTLCKKQPKGRIAALEILIVNTAIAANIREGKTHQIASAMQIGGKLGMKLLNDSLLDHVRNGIVDPVEAYIKCVNKEDMANKLRENGIKFDPAAIEEGGEAARAPAASAAKPAVAAGQSSGAGAGMQAPKPALPQQVQRGPVAQPGPGGAPAAPAGKPASPAYGDPFDQFKKKQY